MLVFYAFEQLNKHFRLPPLIFHPQTILFILHDRISSKASAELIACVTHTGENWAYAMLRISNSYDDPPAPREACCWSRSKKTVIGTRHELAPYTSKIRQWLFEMLLFEQIWNLAPGLSDSMPPFLIWFDLFSDITI